MLNSEYFNAYWNIVVDMQIEYAKKTAKVDKPRMKIVFFRCQLNKRWKYPDEEGWADLCDVKCLLLFCFQTANKFWYADNTGNISNGRKKPDAMNKSRDLFLRMYV